jgi:hypothetical protein
MDALLPLRLIASALPGGLHLYGKVIGMQMILEASGKSIRSIQKFGLHLIPARWRWDADILIAFLSRLGAQQRPNKGRLEDTRSPVGSSRICRQMTATAMCHQASGQRIIFSAQVSIHS